MDGLSVFWTNKAQNQRDRIFDYWNNRNQSKTYSMKLIIAIRERTDLLKEQPELEVLHNIQTPEL